jgi:hypothetical protein
MERRENFGKKHAILKANFFTSDLKSDYRPLLIHKFLSSDPTLKQLSPCHSFSHHQMSALI